MSSRLCLWPQFCWNTSHLVNCELQLQLSLLPICAPKGSSLQFSWQQVMQLISCHSSSVPLSLFPVPGQRHSKGHLGPRSLQASSALFTSTGVIQWGSERLKGLRNTMLYKSCFLMNNFKKLYSNKPKAWRKSLHVFATCQLETSVCSDL